MHSPILTPAYKSTYPGASVGFLALRGADNPAHHPELQARKTALEAHLRDRFAGYDRQRLKALPTLAAYIDYYKGFKKTYHVLLQLESIALGGKSIPSVAALVEAMFMAELKNQLLTSGHDLSRIVEPLSVNVATGNETFVRMNGEAQELKANDMFIADAEGILSSIIYGADRRTAITPQTRDVLFTVYAPPGIDPGAVRAHLADIGDNVRLVAPQAEIELLEVYTA